MSPKTFVVISPAHVDVLIVGAGLSGVTAAYRLSTESPDKTFLVTEARNAIGGTWDLFRYPGIRSDSDMYTFGFTFEPWQGESMMADGLTIKAYIEDTVKKHDLNRFIKFGQRVCSASWSSSENLWTVELLCDEEPMTLTCNFLWMCTGYYDYKQGYSPPIAGLDKFRGQIIHPQNWPEDLDYAGARIVVIGSGATAVTLVPELAKTAEHVTMLQRSPSYIAEVPSSDPLAKWLNSFLPRRLTAQILRWKGIFYQTFVFRLARKWPQLMKRILLKPLKKFLSRQDIEEHFTPRYSPWEQRLCADADGEFFAAIRSDKASVVTDTIQTFHESGIILESGKEIEADMVVTATGLVVKLFGDIKISVDGNPLLPAQHLLYKGTMLNDVPNMCFALGYTNMSWTLKCDLSARYVTRLLNFMTQQGFNSCVPRVKDPDLKTQNLLDFSSGYLRRADDILPKQGSKGPWKLHQSYLHDLMQTGWGKLNDDVMEFS